jgi:hypothetical protein
MIYIQFIQQLQVGVKFLEGLLCSAPGGLHCMQTCWPWHMAHSVD